MTSVRETRERMWAAFEPSRASLALVAIISVLSGVALAIVTWAFTWSADIDRNLRAADALLAGHFGTVEGYVYSPFAAAITVPLLAIPAGAAVLVWFGAKVAAVLAGAAAATRDLPVASRGLIAVSVLSFVPIVHDLLLGNVTVALAAAVAVLAWQRDRALTGIPLGIVLAAVPKPVLIPVLVWMLLHRPRALVGALVVAAVATAATVMIFGIGPYLTWIDALRNPPILSSGNFALSSWQPASAVLASAVTIAATFVALRRGEWPGLVCAVCCGLLVSTYTVVYGAGLLLVVVPALARAAPRATILLALTAPIGLIAAFPAWVGAVMVVALAVPTDAWSAAERVSLGGDRNADPAGSTGTVSPPLVP
jgi:hypothetical protein